MCVYTVYIYKKEVLDSVMWSENDHRNVDVWSEMLICNDRVGSIYENIIDMDIDRPIRLSHI